VALLGLAARAQQPAATSPHSAVSSAEAAEAQQARPRSGGEGIKVHGHWKIVVRNADGSFVKQTEFENSLVTPLGGDVVLSQLFNQQAVIAGWAVFADSTTSTALCPVQVASTGVNSCGVVSQLYDFYSDNLVFYEACIFDVAAGGSGTNCFAGLTQTYTAPTFRAGVGTATPATFALQGNFTPTASGPITSVHTVVVGCSSSAPGVSVAVTSAQCFQGYTDPSSGNYGPPAGTTVLSSTFTQTTLPSPLTVTAGQQVLISVTFSFS
jgi:hypothetical protein